jgi:hypothetical protein
MSSKVGTGDFPYLVQVDYKFKSQNDFFAFYLRKRGKPRAMAASGKSKNASESQPGGRSEL